MSWSLKLHNGDFATEGADLAIVTGESKLVQDLRLHLLEEFGTDNLHPEYGSDIDNVIGEADIDLAILQIESEINRIVQEEQDQQLARAKQDRFTYGRATLDPGEVIVNLTDINIVQQQDKLNVQAVIETGSGEQIGLTIPIDTDTQLGDAG